MTQDAKSGASSDDETNREHRVLADDEIPVINQSGSMADENCSDTDNDSDNCSCANVAAADPSLSEPQSGDAEHLLTPTPTPASSLLADLEVQRARADEYEQRLKLALADYQNLSRRTEHDIEAGMMKHTADVMTDMITIRDDLGRARDTFAKDNVDISGLDSILRNMDSALARHGVSPIDALGEIFDPAMHEAVSTEVNGTLDDNTITREVRRGYTLKNTIIRPSMVVISKKEQDK